MIPVPKAGLEIGRGAMTNDPFGLDGFPCSDLPLSPELPFVSDDWVLLDCESDTELVDSGKFCWARAVPTQDMQANSPAHKIQRNAALGIPCDFISIPRLSRV